jgi:septum formation protein
MISPTPPTPPADPYTLAQFTVVEIATIEFDPIPDVASTAQTLIAEGDVMHCAGALMAEHPLIAQHVRTVRGGSIDAVLGLSSTAVCAALNGLAKQLAR